MDRQTITVDIAPGAYAEQRLKLSQGDIGRPLGVYITQNGVALDCSGYSAVLYVLKPDNNYYMGACTVDGNLISWESAEQETPLAGNCEAQIRLMLNGSDVGTARFIEYVEQTPIDGATPSESDISAIQAMVNRAETAASGAEASATAAHESVEVIEEIISAYSNPETLVIDCGTVSSLPKTIENASIEDDMVVVNSEIGTPSVQSGDWTVTTGTGSLTISGTISGSTTLKLYLMKSR